MASDLAILPFLFPPQITFPADTDLLPEVVCTCGIRLSPGSPLAYGAVLGLRARRPSQNLRPNIC